MDHVELAMVLAVDGSASVTYDEFGLIAGGMAVALRDPAVAAGLIGTSVLSLLLWSGAGQQDVITGWTRISTEADLRAFSDDVENMPRTVTAGTTTIGEALLASLTLPVKTGMAGDLHPAVQVSTESYKKFTSQDELGHFLLAQYKIRTPKDLTSCEVCHR